MQELIPVAVGIILALAMRQISAPRTRLAAMVAASLLGGLLVTALVGELALSWGFIWVDAFIILAAASVSTLALTAWTRRTAPARVR